MIRASSIAVCALALVACHRSENIGTVAGPPLTVEPDAAVAAPSSAAPAPASSTTTSSSTAPAPSSAAGGPSAVPTAHADAPVSPVLARFEDLAPGKKSGVTLRACEQAFVAVARGKANAAGEALAPDDVLVAQGVPPFVVTGDGLVAIASVQPRQCDAGQVKPWKKVVRATAARELTWANGAMHAHLDVEGAASPLAYFGRLDGTAPVAEHAHDGSWETLLAVEAAGTFTLGGKEQRLGPREIVQVPPGVAHAWSPDPGSRLVAFQIYTPPGPEQRFKKLAADAARAGGGAK